MITIPNPVFVLIVWSIGAVFAAVAIFYAIWRGATDGPEKGFSGVGLKLRVPCWVFLD
jgi:hypothetical protein